MTFNIRQMRVKKIIGKIHLWLGLICGLVVVVSMTAAAIFVWDAELSNWYYRDYIYIQPQSTPTQPLAQLWANAQKAVPGKTITWVEIANDPAKTYQFSAYQQDKTAKGWTYWADFKYWDNVYINPYTGEVVGQVNMLSNWIDLTRRLHQNLLLRYEIGHYIIGFATLFVIISLLTGLVLWWPKNKAALKQRLAFNWKASTKWKRKNYDIHNVGGFYAFLLILILAITGLVWTFDWWTDGIYRLLGDDPKTVFKQNDHPQPAPQATGVQNPLDIALADLKNKRQNWESISLDLPVSKAKQAATEFSAYLSFDATAWDDGDSYSYHAQTGELIHEVRQEQKTIGEAWRNSNYAIHVGEIYGWPTKILATFAALLLASLPVTGVLIWWGRRKKLSKPVKSKVASAYT